MIDEKKLIIWIKCHCNPYGKPDFDYDTSMKIIDFIENYQTKVCEWIPCSERLPELHKQDLDSEGEYFMISDPVIVTDGENISVSQYEIDDVENNGWLNNGSIEDDSAIIAWMPLPDPYR